MAEQKILVSAQPKSRSARLITWVSKFFCFISASALAAMMLVSLADIVGRSFLHPIKGIFEMVGLLMVVAGTLGLGYCQLVKGNIMINLVTDHLKPRWRALILGISALASIAVCILVCWQVGARMIENTNNGAAGLTMDLRWPVWPFMCLMVLGFAWATVIFAADLIKLIKEVFQK